MGKALATACVLVAACQPMYERKAAPLGNPPRRPPPKGQVAVDDPVPLGH